MKHLTVRDGGKLVFDEELRDIYAQIAHECVIGLQSCLFHPEFFGIKTTAQMHDVVLDGIVAMCRRGAYLHKEYEPNDVHEFGAFLAKLFDVIRKHPSASVFTWGIGNET